MQEDKKSKLFVFLVILGIFVVGGLGWIVYGQKKNSGRVKVKAICKDCSVIFLNVDILGAKHMPCYGYERNTAENLCRFGEENVFFESAYTNSTWTLPSQISMFTGLNVFEHQVCIVNQDRLSENMLFLPDVLQQNKYHTFLQTTEVFESFPRDLVYNRGVDDFYSLNESWISLLEKMEDVKQKKGKFFSFLYTGELHDPYLLKEGEKLEYVDEKVEGIPSTEREYWKVSPGLVEYAIRELENEEQDLGKKEREKRRKMLEKLRSKEGDLEALEKLMIEDNLSDYSKYIYNYNWYNSIDLTDEKQIEYIKALYDQKIEREDERFGRFVEAFFESDLVENTILVVTSTHGEEFMEHGNITHVSLYNENIKIPLMIYVPGLESRRVESIVQGADLMPTILDLVGIDVDESQLDGKSLVEEMKGEGRGVKERLVVSSVCGRRAAVIRGKWKLFLEFNHKVNKFVGIELYNLEKDKDEENDVLLENQRLVKKMLREYERLLGNF